MTHQEMIEVLKNLNLVKVVPMDIGNKVERLTDKEYQALQYFIGVGERMDVNKLKLNTVKLLDAYFPKNKCKERGAALAFYVGILVSILTFLREGKR